MPVQEVNVESVRRLSWEVKTSSVISNEARGEIFEKEINGS